MVKGDGTMYRTTQRSRAEKLAAGFRRNEDLERLLALKRADRAAFDRLPVEMRMALAHYEGAREAHRDLHGREEDNDRG